DPAIRAVISDEYFQNPNVWHVKVTLVNYATVEMHQSNRVLRQFRFQQLIRVAPEVLDDHHKIDLRQRKPYLLSADERQQQLCVQRERRGPLNPRKRDDDACPSTRPKHSPGLSSAADTATRPSNSTDDIHGTAFSDDARCIS
ncbi:hypothetical protein Godav_024553, partial [Gossypium davidsonii]|nr:hypothetical protein [Gossypium davidsonii]